MIDNTLTLTAFTKGPEIHTPAETQPTPGTGTPDELIGAAQNWSWVVAAPFRAHVRRVLAVEPVPWRAFAGYARVPDNVVRGLLGLGRRPLRRIAPHYAHALLDIDPRNFRADLVRPGEPAVAVAAARALVAAGWTVARISRAGSIAEPRLRALLHGEHLAITQRTALLLAAAARAHRIGPEDLDGIDAAAAPFAA